MNASCILDFPYFQEMTVGKTPVSVLQELLSRRGTTPKYELVQIEGAIHEPTFRYRVTVADVVGMYGSENNVP
jgi:dsRNA-specific ribonuclease